MLQPLQLGNKTFPINIIQGPLAGVSCAPFRYLTWKWGAPAFSCTEMISCKTLISQPKLAAERFTLKHPNEGPVSFQLSGSDPKELALATQIATDYGADLIDLNCGCPVKKIRARGAGSSLLTQFSKLAQLISAMKANTHVPVSIKIRVEGNSAEKFNFELAKMLNESGVDFVVVHGRHWTEHYETPCRHEQIQFFVDALNIPVIGNGDVACVKSLENMLKTGCAGVMIGRAGVGQPWLTEQLIAEISGKKYSPPTLVEIGNILMEHIAALAILLKSEKFAILQARKIAKYYARNLENRVDFLENLNACKTLTEFNFLCESFFM